MALATQCPYCHTTFRVASDQLKLRGGIVRCGSCQRIFDGSAHLVDLEALAAAKKAREAASAEPPAPPSAPASPPPEPRAPQPGARAPDDGAEPVYTLELGHALDPLGILPKAEPDTPAEVQAQTQDAQAAELPQPGAADIDASGPTASGFDPESEPEPEPFESEPALSDPEPLLPGSEPLHTPAYESTLAPAGPVEPDFGPPVDETLYAQPLPDDEPHPAPDAAPQPDEAPTGTAIEGAPGSGSALPRHADQADGMPPVALPLRASADTAPLAGAGRSDAAGAGPRTARAKAIDARTRRSKLTPTRIETPKLRVPADLDSDEPEFVKRSRRQEQSGKTVRILMGAGAVVLLALLAGQLLLHFRNELAVRHPAARPALASFCALAGCRVGLPTQAENLVIDDGELAPIGTDTYSLNTTLRNQGKLVLAWPSIELELTDANNKPVLRRVFGPADYLPPGPQLAAGFAARSEQPVRLNFALAELKPSGYHIFVFYP